MRPDGLFGEVTLICNLFDCQTFQIEFAGFFNSSGPGISFPCQNRWSLILPSAVVPGNLREKEIPELF